LQVGLSGFLCGIWRVLELVCRCGGGWGGGDFLEQLSDCQFLKDLALWS
jgi:hypothetical protein